MRNKCTGTSAKEHNRISKRRFKFNFVFRFPFFLFSFNFISALSEATEQISEGFSVLLQENEKLPIASDEKLVIATIARSRSDVGAIVVGVSVSSDFGIEEEVIVLVGDGVGGLAIEGFGNEAKWLELAQHC